MHHNGLAKMVNACCAEDPHPLLKGLHHPMQRWVLTWMVHHSHDLPEAFHAVMASMKQMSHLLVIVLRSPHKSKRLHAVLS